MERVVTALLACGAMVSVVAWIVALLRENGVCPLDAAARFVRGLPWGGRLAVLPLFAALVVYGSVKNHSNEIGSESGFNRVERVDGDESVFNAETQSRGDAQRGEGGDFGHIFTTPNLQLLTPNDSASPPVNAVVCEDWKAFGAFEDWIYLTDGRWSFRFGTDFVEKIRIFSCGGIDFFPNGGISMLSLPVSIVPEANWGLVKSKQKSEKSEGNSLPLTSCSSLFWHCFTPSNTLVLTWQNALLFRQADMPVSLQAELFPSGAAQFRYDFSSLPDCAVLSNAAIKVMSVESSEMFSLATGTVVFVHMEAPQLPQHDYPEEVKSRFAHGNTNAYYYADMAVAKGPSIVKVKCDSESTLGSYSLVAYPGETNRIPFLIGPKYEVESEAAFSHFAVTNSEVSVSNVTDRLSLIQWPMAISFDGGNVDDGMSFGIAVNPPFVEGIVEWDGTLARSGGCPCCILGTNGTVTVSSDCECNPCVHEGSYTYEGYRARFRFTHESPPKGESGGTPDNPEVPPEEPPASVGISFDKSAVIFEDEYENSPGDVVPRRSTRVTLKCTAYGGERGGRLDVDLSGMEGLKLVSGTPPTSRGIGVRETVEFEAVYEGEAASSRENGTIARVTFTENETNIKFDDEATITVVEVVISPMKIARDNMLPGRHKFGVCEVVSCRQEPNMPLVTWDAEYGYFHLEGSMHYFHCPLYACENPIKAVVGDIELIPNISVHEPQGVIAKNVTFKDYGVHPGRAGYVGMELDVYISPFDVSFEEIDVEEVPNENGSHVGYFAMSYFSNIWYHTSGNGAGNWIKIKEDNYFGIDLAAYTESIPKVYLTGLDEEDILGWYYGYLSWHIPYGWRSSKPNGSAVLPYKHFAQDTRQELTLESNGTLTISKLNCWVSRSTNEVIMIYGEEE